MKNKGKNNISIYDYTNYRCFLRDKFSELKNKNPLFSYRAFTRLSSLGAPDSLQRILNGARNLGDDGIKKIVKGLRFTENEKKYFGVLVKFNQSKDSDEKDHYFRELSQNKRFLAAKPLAAAHYELFSHWYYVAILEMARIETLETINAKWVQAHINPPVGLVEIKRAIEALKILGLLKERKNGKLKRIEAMLKTDDEVASVALTNFHVQMSEMAGRAVLKEDYTKREFATLTLVTSEESFKRAVQQIRLVRDNLHSTLEQERDGPKNIVAHLNLQLFRLNK